MLLAAGAGTRYGGPKALATDTDGTSWLLRSVDSVAACDSVVVVLGASADEAASLLPESVRIVVAADWAEGMGASLRAGLEALDEAHDAALVTLVDLPDVDARVVERVLAAATRPAVLARATYAGTPGHPVLIGRDHWAGVLASSVGDAGARAYLASHADAIEMVECGDLATGADQDTP